MSPSVAERLSIVKEERRNSKKAFLKRYETLKQDISSYIPHYREIAEVILPRRIRYLYDRSRNRGEKMNQKIINSTGARALRILSAGMMSGISSPARPWFRLQVPFPALMDNEDVRNWLHAVEESMRQVFAKSNIYNTLQLTYRDLGAWGISAMFVEEDDIDTIRGYSYPIGSFVAQNSSRLTIDTVYYECWMTVGQVAERFGLDNASLNLKRMWQDNRHDDPVRILHCVEPNEVYEAGQLGKKGKRYRSVWLEYESSDNAVDGIPLHEGNGFHEFPAMVPRWDVSADDVYGSSPGMEALGDIKALQQLEKRKLSALDKILNPPMVAPVSLQREKRSQLAGDVTFIQMSPGGQKFEPAYQVDSKVVFVREEIAHHEQRVLQQFYADLFLMISNMDQAQPITAREVDERHEEKMLQLGPVLERLHDELLTPLIDRTFEIMARKGMLPPAPPVLQGMELRVEFISILAQAQKLLGTISLERLVAFVGNTVAVFPEAKDKLDIDEAIDDYAGMLGTKPNLVVTGDKLAAKRAARAQQEKMSAMAQMAKPLNDASGAASNLASADQGQPEVLNGLVGALQGQ
jgi:hypothetical protein